MKNLSLLFIVFLLLQISSFAQQEFFNENPPQMISAEGEMGSINVTLDSLMLDSIITAL
ncbi:MAG: hypothetical protein IPJ23_19275 [Ignavibacteriales bacterium]|nr:hypothetical protein [Ignavibacteriales bacterium]